MDLPIEGEFYLNPHEGSLPQKEFAHPGLRDLAWILTSPPLMGPQLGSFNALEFDPDTKAAAVSWLAYLDKTANLPQTLERARFNRLGLYFEELLAFFFSRGWRDGVSPVKLLGRNRQIFVNRITVGELDFLLESPANKLIHLECAVKFYMAERSSSHLWENWIGPNAKDRLDLKLNHLLNHQLPLAKSTDVVTTFGIDVSNVESNYLLRGAFFSEFNSAITLPANAHPNALMGRWIRQRDFKAKYAGKSANWQVLDKLEWLSGPARSIAYLNHTHENSKLEQLPKMLVIAESRRGPNELEENLALTRLLVVDDHWPDSN